MEPPLDEFCHNEILDLMGNKRRRYILCYLVRANGPIECSDLARQIAAWEHDSSPEQVTTSQYQSVYNSLYQTHVPRMKAVGLVEYDRSENLIYPAKRIVEIELVINSVVPQIDARSTDDVRSLVSGVLLCGAMAGTFLLFLAGNLSVAFVVAFVSWGLIAIGGLSG